MTLRPGAVRPSDADLITQAAALIGMLAPQGMRVLPTMPVHATGKVDRRALLLLV